MASKAVKRWNMFRPVEWVGVRTLAVKLDAIVAELFRRMELFPELSRPILCWNNHELSVSNPEWARIYEVSLFFHPDVCRLRGRFRKNQSRGRTSLRRKILRTGPHAL